MIYKYLVFKSCVCFVYYLNGILCLLAKVSVNKSVCYHQIIVSLNVYYIMLYFTTCLYKMYLQHAHLHVRFCISSGLKTFIGTNLALPAYIMLCLHILCYVYTLHILCYIYIYNDLYGRPGYFAKDKRVNLLKKWKIKIKKTV